MRHTLVLLLLALFACGDDSAPIVPTDGASDAPIGDAGQDLSTDASPLGDAVIDGTLRDLGGGPDASGDAGMPATPGCFSGPLDVTETADGVQVRTAHYELTAQVERSRAERFARMLESAYEPYVSFFGRPPSSEGRLSVKFLRDEAAFQQALRDDGISDVGDAGGYYAPSTQTAYLHDQPTRYYARQLLLHEAAHQAHFLTRSSGDLPFWYVEGVAEFLSRHHWDGRCVTLGIRPLLSQEDPAAAALQDLQVSDTSLTDVVSGSLVPSRALALSIFRFFTYSDGGRLNPSLRAFRQAVDRGDDIVNTFNTALGTPTSFDAAWRAFVEEDQEAMTVVFLQWIHRTPTEVVGLSPEFFSIARLKTPVAHFDLSFEPPATEGWAGGVLLGYEDAALWQALVVRDSGAVSLFRSEGGGATWNRQGDAPPADEGQYHFSVEYSGAEAHVTINGVRFDIANELPQLAGPAVDSAEILFEEVSWRH